MRAQCFPRGLHIAGPKESGVTLHACRAIPMKGKRTLVRPPELRPLPVHPVAVAPRRLVEAVALVRPPAVDARIEDAAVRGPVAANRKLVRTRGRTKTVSSSGQPAAFSFYDHVHYDAEMLGVEAVDHALRIWKIGGVPCEFGVPRVPT